MANENPANYRGGLDQALLNDVVALYLGQPVRRADYTETITTGHLPMLLAQFVSTACSTSWGANFGDVDNDSYLDLYLGTGGGSYKALMPNRMLRSAEGKVF
jgi:hypothetical protein